MLQRKIREVVGCLRTLKKAQENPYAGAGGVARDLETDCMVKLALLFPLLPEQEFPQEIEEALLELQISTIPVWANNERDYTKIAFRVRDERTVVDCRTGEVVRMVKPYTTLPELGSPTVEADPEFKIWQF